VQPDCHWIFQRPVFAVLANLLVQSEHIDLKIVIVGIDFFVKQLCTNALNELLLLRVRKDPLRSSIGASGWSPLWISSQVLPPCRECRAADLGACGKECKAAPEWHPSLQWLEDGPEWGNIVVLVLGWWAIGDMVCH
jgi:hypothetical protein